MEMNLVMPNNYVELEQEEMMYVDGGDVGVRVTWSNRISSMGAWAAGVFVTGVVAYYLRHAAAKGPWSAGLVALISSGLGIAVGWAIGKGLNYVLMSIPVPFFSYIHNVHVS